MDALLEICSTSAYCALETTLAVQSTPVVAVVGAGISQPAGVPGWDALRLRLCDGLRDQGVGADESVQKRLRLAAERSAREKDFWAAFDSLRKDLGLADYRAILRDALEISDTASIPDSYQHLWTLPLRGVLSLNLDSLAKRAHSASRPGDELKIILGRDAGRLPRLVHSPHRFLYQLHGTTDDFSSWVFTRSELQTLYDTPGYTDFLRIVFSSCTVLFLGVTADDLAIGAPLLNLSGQGVDGLTHYWITDRRDSEAEVWASTCGVRLIRYPSGQHDLVPQLLARLGSARAPEIVADPVLISSSDPAKTLPSIPELIALPLDDLRILLNGHACYLLSMSDGASRFERFLNQYEEAIDRAWFIPKNAEGTSLFGYTLQQSSLAGAFGRVFPAIDPNGKLCALKLIRREIRNNLPLLQSYRRGVRAMQILAKREVAGMVAYRAASEIPALVTMDWIDGPNLAEAKTLHYLDQWETILWVAVELCKVIRNAHSLPERVLHRDIRPANIMLKNGWNHPEDWELLVLDFDLSTYHGAEEKSVLAEQSVLGYLAPEQMDRSSSFSSQSALVDSFGIGMTLYFLCGSKEPRANFESSAQFPSMVKSATRIPDGATWRSIPRRIERLILSATRQQQNHRPDVSQILNECERLQLCLLDPTEPVDADLTCEEIASRTPSLADRYFWDEGSDCAKHETASGIIVELCGSLDGDEISLGIAWSARGTELWASLRTIPEKIQRAESLLKQGGWQKIERRSGQGDLNIRANLAIIGIQSRLDKASESLESALQAITLR